MEGFIPKVHEVPKGQALPTRREHPNTYTRPKIEDIRIYQSKKSILKSDRYKMLNRSHNIKKCLQPKPKSRRHLILSENRTNT